MPQTFPLNSSLHRNLPYADGLELQKKTLKKIAEDPVAPQELLFCEHAPVITLGRSGDGSHLQVSEKFLQQQGISYYPAGRGGDITYHGPGQWTVYPILRIGEFCRDLHRYMRLLEDVVIIYLQEHQIESGRREGKTGVWVGRNKICAIGVAVSRWISWHGLALNINTNLTPFRSYMTPCGISTTDGGVTSLQEITGQTHDMQQEAQRLTETFKTVLGKRFNAL